MEPVIEMEKKLSIEIVEAVRTDILEGRISGNTFLTESELAARFGVSKGPVKEAMHILVQEGYLVGYPRKGYMVETVSVEDLRQVTQLRLCIEKMCVSQAIHKARREELQALMDNLSEDCMEKSPYNTNNTQFHLKLAELAGNKYAVSALYKLLGITARCYINTRPDNQMHRAIVEAMLKKDEAAALRALESDILHN